MYRIIRFYKDAKPGRRVIATGLTEAEAKAHCQDPETSSSTCQGKVGKRRTKRLGPWFDSYAESR